MIEISGIRGIIWHSEHNENFNSQSDTRNFFLKLHLVVNNELNPPITVVVTDITQSQQGLHCILYISMLFFAKFLVFTTVTYIAVPQPASLATALSTPLHLSFIPLVTKCLDIAVQVSCVCPHLPNCLNSTLSDASSDQSSHTQQSSWQGSPH